MFALLFALTAPFSAAAAQADTAVIAQALITPPDSVPIGPVWDINVHSYETHERVQHFVGLFSGKVRDEFAKSLQRQTRYGDLIRQKLRDGGLPEDMTYLALIESWYDPNAFSKAAAVGIWQFMAGTARGVGLRVDWWMDERRDPVRSTEGAVRLLSGLRTQFGSLYLAAAAYDGGDGRVSRGLLRYAGKLDGVEGEDRFFSLADTKYLRPETRDYVPKIIAAALVGKEPSRYGVLVDSLPPLAFDTVRVAGATSLAGIANATGATAQLVHELNNQLLRGMTPPGDSAWVRVPVGSALGFDERFSALEPAERNAVLHLTTKKNESMASIAKVHGLSAKQLGWYNPKATRLKNGNLAPGQTILVPTRQTVSVAADVPNPSLERYPHRAKTPAKKTPAKKPALHR
jgi:membrane-bound lytic murein transglycosylase D